MSSANTIARRTGVLTNVEVSARCADGEP